MSHLKVTWKVYVKKSDNAMNEQRNFILAIGLSILVLLIWQYFIGNSQIDERTSAQISNEMSLQESQDLSNIPLPESDVESEDKIDKPVIVQSVNNLLINEIIKDITPGKPAF